jgi:hypothetical protein
VGVAIRIGFGIGRHYLVEGNIFRTETLTTISKRWVKFMKLLQSVFLVSFRQRLGGGIGGGGGVDSGGGVDGGGRTVVGTKW